MRTSVVIAALIIGCGSAEESPVDTTTDSSTTTTDSEVVDTGAGGETTPGSDTSTTMDTTVPPSERCAALPMSGTIVNVSDPTKLVQTVYDAKEGDTIVLADGTYPLNGKTLQIRTKGVTLRGKSRAGVIIDSGYSMAAGDSILITASDTTIAHLTVKRAYNHPVHVTPGGADIKNVRIHDVYVLDPGEQGIKVNADTSGHFTDDGIITCSKVELTDAGRPSIRNNCYTGGIDIHRARGWRMSDNEIIGFWCSTGLSEHGIHIWTGSRDSIVERNTIKECARGIGFGLGEGTDGRTYSDMPCGGATKVGHYGGIIRNNFIYASDAAAKFDVGIGLEEACGTKVVHNTVFSTYVPLSSSIEWRFGKTNVELTNNLTSHVLKDRGAGAVATNKGNVSTATASMFASAGDVHLKSSVAGAVDVTAGLCDDDIDGDPRSTPRDVGADEMK
jgi:hypothetical protein